MRILHVHKYYHKQDGAGRYMLELMRLQELTGHVVAPFAMHEERNGPSVWDKYFVSSLETKRVSFGLNGIRQLFRIWWSREAARKMAAMLDAFQPDVIHVHNIYTHLSPSVLAVCRRRGLPVVMTVHDYALVSANYALWDGERSLTPQRLSLLSVAKTRFIKGSFVATLILEAIYRLQRKLKLYDKAIDVYLPSSNFVADALIAVGYPKDKIKVMPLFAGNLLPGVELESNRGREGVLYAGRLEDYKGIDLYLEAAFKFSDTQFYIAGVGPREPDVRAASEQASNIHPLGFLTSEQLWDKMGSVKLVVVPSRWAEPYGLVAIEAMACGTPVLVSDAGGLPEKVKDGVNGLIFKAGDLQDLLKTLKQALREPRTLERLGEGAGRYAKAQADPVKHVNKILEVYNSLVIHR